MHPFSPRKLSGEQLLFWEVFRAPCKFRCLHSVKGGSRYLSPGSAQVTVECGPGTDSGQGTKHLDRGKKLPGICSRALGQVPEVFINGRQQPSFQWHEYFLKKYCKSVYDVYSVVGRAPCVSLCKQKQGGKGLPQDTMLPQCSLCPTYYTFFFPRWSR